MKVRGHLDHRYPAAKPMTKKAELGVREEAVAILQPSTPQSDEATSRCEPPIPSLKQRSFTSAMFQSRSQALSSALGRAPAALASDAACRRESSSSMTLSSVRGRSCPNR
eukprot:CAMPEP_0197629602 /NCGR_PEP_ID=MMETSP1338-20131121/7386_1 /TAXON_ID=43686 ORGANISM="Pelagodinium beii, Strain RCC1491" /NCGR_SAMPLE_ID=MMETSP1338 /ASSEMBLY_ACC=CAM_ASM_000754 /LENGTH=109 /DNA_ID=CAMNT_0043200669 /DNA_START=454 /DNA_END=784 /DNA_ORIENTATION=+